VSVPANRRCFADIQLCEYPAQETAGYETCCRLETDVQGVFYLNQAMPFGGVKASGHGRFGTPQHIIPRTHTNVTGGEEGLRSLCTPKSIIHDRLFSLIRTPIPKVVGKCTILLHTCDELTKRFPTSRSICFLGIPARASMDCVWRHHTEDIRSRRIDQGFFGIDTYDETYLHCSIN